jgi:hypothetical protein
MRAGIDFCLSEMDGLIESIVAILREKEARLHPECTPEQLIVTREFVEQHLRDWRRERAKGSSPADIYLGHLIPAICLL